MTFVRKTRAFYIDEIDTWLLYNRIILFKTSKTLNCNINFVNFLGWALIKKGPKPLIEKYYDFYS